MPASVQVVIATYGRPALLTRALASLVGQGPSLAGVTLVDNAADPATAGVAAAAPLPVTVLTARENLGTAGGLALGLRHAFAQPAFTHAWILDDDAVATPGALPAMLAAAEAVGAGAVTAMVTDHAGVVRWFPGPLPQPAWDVIRSGVTPEDFRARCGPTPQRWNWATWASMLITRRAVEAVGYPDAALWFQGTDIEYSLRLSARFPCVLAPLAVCPHLPPAGDPAAQRRKDLWALQNNAYIATRLPHGRRILRHLPGNHFRYWRDGRWSASALRETLAAFWQGAVLGRVATQRASTATPTSPATR